MKTLSKYKIVKCKGDEISDYLEIEASEFKVVNNSILIMKDDEIIIHLPKRYFAIIKTK